MIISELKLYKRHDPTQEVDKKDDFFFKKSSVLKDYLNNPIQHETLNGLFLVQNKYGRTFVNRLKIFSEDYIFLNDNLTEDEDVQGLLIHKYLNDEELKYIQMKFEKNPSFKIYIVAHYYYDFIKVYQQCFNYINNKNSIEVMVTYDRSDKNIINVYNVIDYFKQNKNVVFCNIKKDVSSVQELNRTKNRTDLVSNFPFFVLNFIKYLINPLNEFKKILLVAQDIKHIYLNRIFELFSVLKYIFVNLFVAIYYFNKKSSGFLKIRTIKIIFLIRHIMLMAIFKTYGMLVDFLFFIHRFCTLILPYPLFKIYWFCRFQYNKRLKKIIGYIRD